jgi:hypothetical protein
MSAPVVPPEVLDAVDRGRSVIPIGPNKRPLIDAWKPYQTTAATREQVERWAAGKRPAAWAVVTGAISGLVALDFDGNEGQRLHERHGLPAHVRTGSGGTHVYVAHPGHYVATLNGKAKRDLGQRFPGLDIKGDGGYAIFAGRNGNGPYVLNDPEPLALDALPAVLRALLDTDSPPSADTLLRWALGRATPGGRNQVGFDLACQLRDNRHGRSEAERALCEYAARVPVGDDPYTEAEALASVQQAYSAPAREPWSSKPRASSNGARLKVEWKEGPRGALKLVLPETPRQDVARLCEWLTVVFNLDCEHPVTGGSRDGLAGPDGHAVLKRAGTRKALRFEPIKRLSTPAKLAEDLEGWGLPTDGEVYGFTAEHARKISHVVRMLCGATERMSAEQETEAIIGTFLQRARSVEGHTTYGTSAQRYEAAAALSPNLGAERYLIDKNTGELVIAVSDLQEAARRHTGSSLPRGWLDARMDAIDWTRCRLDGHGEPGEDGRRLGPHARVSVYRGHLPAESADGAVTT